MWLLRILYHSMPEIFLLNIYIEGHNLVTNMTLKNDMIREKVTFFNLLFWILRENILYFGKLKIPQGFFMAQLCLLANQTLMYNTSLLRRTGASTNNSLSCSLDWCETFANRLQVQKFSSSAGLAVFEVTLKPSLFHIATRQKREMSIYAKVANVLFRLQ